MLQGHGSMALLLEELVERGPVAGELDGPVTVPADREDLVGHPEGEGAEAGPVLGVPEDPSPRSGSGPRRGRRGPSGRGTWGSRPRWPPGPRPVRCHLRRSGPRPGRRCRPRRRGSRTASWPASLETGTTRRRGVIDGLISGRSPPGPSPCRGWRGPSRGGELLGSGQAGGNLDQGLRHGEGRASSSTSAAKGGRPPGRGGRPRGRPRRRWPAGPGTSGGGRGGPVGHRGSRPMATETLPAAVPSSMTATFHVGLREDLHEVGWTVPRAEEDWPGGG